MSTKTEEYKSNANVGIGPFHLSLATGRLFSEFYRGSITHVKETKATTDRRLLGESDKHKPWGKDKFKQDSPIEGQKQ